MFQLVRSALAGSLTILIRMSLYETSEAGSRNSHPEHVRDHEAELNGQDGRGGEAG
jgi:hypothetical protein